MNDENTVVLKEFRKQIIKEDKKRKTKSNINWILKVTLVTFIVSIILSFFSSAVISNINILFSFLFVVIFIFIGVIFDMIGIAVTSADEKPFHSMRAKKMHGSKTAIMLIKNASKVSSMFNDVIGDISGIISGSSGIMIATSISSKFNISPVVTSLIITALVASATIGGKAIGKSYAINHSDMIIYNFSKILARFTE
jgi:CBS domain containing-hemolysin-like protein